MYVSCTTYNIFLPQFFQGHYFYSFLYYNFFFYILHTLKLLSVSTLNSILLILTNFKITLNNCPGVYISYYLYIPNLFYSIIFVILPAPIVLPPSLIANLSPSSIAIGVIKFTSISVLSPGIIISIPVGSATFPVTSVVLK